MSLEDAKRVKKKYELNLKKYPYVKGVGIGFKVVGGKKTDQLAIITTVVKKQPLSLLSPKEIIPKSLEGIPTDVQEIGNPMILPPRPSTVDRTSKIRPSPCGVSVGHYAITAGTQGLIVKDASKTYILSNNHVLANENRAAIGDPVLQPGPYDGGKNPDDIIAKLSRFVTLKGQISDCTFAGIWTQMYNIPNSYRGGKTRLYAFADADNEVDCAIAEVNLSDIDPTILEIGKPKGAKEPQLGILCKKSGRTTGLTKDGPVDLLDWSGDIGYSNGNLHFVGQGVIISDNWSGGGDSGSSILDQEDDIAIGLLFAGSDQATIFNPINKVLEALQVEVLV